MKVFKEFSFSDVGAGPIHMADITINCPTEILPRLVYISAFDNDVNTVKVNFVPSVGSSLQLQAVLSNLSPAIAPPPYGYGLHHANNDVDNVSFFC